ncbi:SAVED domain-containing protein [Streptomyces sp. NPDC127091]|uniref:SAVED domain-containing protein n=1 Tax=Streptomyces sp. NPDC127091 TaxID=3347134 RepID=UPI00364C2A55
MAISDTERLKAWVRAGGRCEFCGNYLLEGKLTYKDFTLGELAHIVGRDVAPGSPRGMDPLPEDERDLADNLMLLCRGEHNEIDRKGSLDLMTVERLRAIKREREAWIRRMTGLSPQNGTAVIRLIGAVRGYEVELTKPTAAEAVIRSEERFPDFPLSLHGDGFEIDLRNVTGEEEAEPAYWQQCKRQIDRILEHRLAEALREDAVQHVSAFGFARLPLLVYFGSRLDDTFAVTIYQRHRSAEAWNWPDNPAPSTSFTITSPWNLPQGAEEGVLVLNISGSIQADELPEDLKELPRWVINPAGRVPSVDVIDSLKTLSEFTNSLRSLLSALEAQHKHMQTLHVLAAAPVSAAVALGRVHDVHVHPKMAIYDRTHGHYTVALEIS